MDDMTVVPTQHKMDADAYYRMAEAGIIGEHDRIELIDGELIDMTPIGQVHEGAVHAFAHALHVACAARAIVSAQNPIRLGRMGER